MKEVTFEDVQIHLSLLELALSGLTKLDFHLD